MDWKFEKICIQYLTQGWDVKYMDVKAYSAGAVKMSFLFMEFRKVVGLMAEGKNFERNKRNQ